MKVWNSLWSLKVISCDQQKKLWNDSSDFGGNLIAVSLSRPQDCHTTDYRKIIVKTADQTGA